MQCLQRRSVKPLFSHGASNGDIIVQPRTRKSVYKPATPISGQSPVSSSEEASLLKGITQGAGAQLQPVQRATAQNYTSAVSTNQLSSPGYAVVPVRGDLPPAVNEPLYPKKNKPQQQTQQTAPVNSSDTLAKHGSSANKRKQQARRCAQPHQQTVAGSLQPRQAMPSAQQQQLTTNTPKPQNTHSVRRNDPGKAFMNAGMPDGLWVLPLDARSEAPPAPPPLAPEDPHALLKVLQNMPPPRRKLVIFKAGGYIFGDMELLIQESGLSHVMRLTNLIRKANCVLAKPVWENGRRVNLKQHQSAAEKAQVPFLVINQVNAVDLVAAVRPLLIKRKTVVEQHHQQQQQQSGGMGP